MNPSFPLGAASEPGSTVRILRAIRERWYIVVGAVVIALVAAAAFVAVTPKKYEASADVVLSPLPTGDETFQGFNLFRQPVDASSAVVTAARAFNSPVIQVAARKAMGADATGTRVSVTPLSQADMLAVTATSPSAPQAARAANAYAEAALAVRTEQFQSQLKVQIDRLQRQVNAIPTSLRTGNFEYAALAQRLGLLVGYRGAPDPTVQLAARATTPLGASWPRPKLTIGAALLASLLLGCGLAVLLELTTPNVAREEELVLDQRLPVLARIPRLRPNIAKGYLLGRTELPSILWREYRTLRARLSGAVAEGFPFSVLVTSASPRDGKTMTAVNLAITLAEGQKRVVLVDADLHRPMVSAVFGRVPRRGRSVSAALESGKVALGSLIESPVHPGLSLLLAPQERNPPTNLFSEERWRELLEALRPHADIVVIDSPPIPEVADAIALAVAAEAVLICVRLGNTRRDKLTQLRELLAWRGIAPIGFVVTSGTRSPRSEPLYGYGQVNQFEELPKLTDARKQDRTARAQDR
jgi:tyrosine-protein kinase